MKRLTPPVVKECRVQDAANEKVLVAHTTLAKSVCAHIIKQKQLEFEFVGGDPLVKHVYRGKRLF